jgi:hypothetical protein
VAFCVLRIEDYGVLYLGSDEASARQANVEGSHQASGPVTSDALKRAALEVGRIRRGQPLPRPADDSYATHGPFPAADAALSKAGGIVAGI